MPRKHVHRLGTPYRRNYPQENMERALLAVLDDNYSFKQAAEMHGVPKSTLYDIYKGQHSDKLGRPPILSLIEERWIVEAMTAAGKFGYPFEKQTIKEFVRYYLNSKGVNIQCFHDNRPGDDWIEHFMGRHREMSLRNCENIKRVKAEITENTISEYFEHLNETVQDVPPENIVNMDETNLTDDPGKKLVFIPRGEKHARRIMDFSKMSTSVMFAAAGDGTCLPPYVVYKSTNLYPDWIEGGPENTQYNRTLSGWFDTQCFEDWFLKTALPYLRRKEGKKVLICDNLASHLSYRIIKSCTENDIQFVFLPKNSTHLCQPLDVAVFGPLKRVWREILTEWKRTHKGVVPKSVFPSLLKKLMEKSKEGGSMSNNIVSGFRATGIIPFDPEQVLKRIRKQPAGGTDNAMRASFTEVMNAIVVPLDQTTTRPKRKSKINVPAGKSVGLKDLSQVNGGPSSVSTSQEDDANGNASSPHQNANNDAKSSLIFSENDGVNEDSSEVSDDDSPEVPEVKLPVTSDTLQKGCFAIVKFLYNEGTKKETTKEFVAQIEKVAKTYIAVKCLRPYKGHKDSFVFPDVEDKSKILIQQVHSILTAPKIHRGIHVFEGLQI